MGAMFTSTLVCELGDVIAAAVTVAGLNHHDECDPIRPVPFLAFHGTDDTVTPMNGSKVGPEGSPERQFFEFEQIMPDELRQFADDFGCTEAVDSSVSESVTLTSYLGCDNEVEVGFYTIEGGGHTWPGSTVFAETPGPGSRRWKSTQTRSPGTSSNVSLFQADSYVSERPLAVYRGKWSGYGESNPGIQLGRLPGGPAAQPR